MKVALIEIWPYGGTAQYAAHLAYGLNAVKESSSEVHLIAPVNYGYDPTNYHLHKIMPELKGAKLGGRVGSVVALSWRRLYQAIRACEELKKIQPQVVHVLGTSALNKRLLNYVRKNGAKLVVTVHDLPQRSERNQFFYNLWSRHFISADSIIVHGERSRVRIGQRYGASVIDRTNVVPIGLYDYGQPNAPLGDLRERYGLPQNKVVVLFFGSLRKNKGLQTIIEALSLERSSQVHLLVAGQRPAKSEPPIEWYKELAKKCGVAERITWLIRYVEDREVADIFSCTDIVALPYMCCFEAQSSVLSIAAAYGAPVVASDVGDIGQTVRKYELGLCVAPESPQAFANALGEISQRLVGWSNKGARDFAEDSDWRNIGQQHWTLYRNTIISQGC